MARRIAAARGRLGTSVRRIAVDRRRPRAMLVLSATVGLRATWRTTIGRRGRMVRRTEVGLVRPGTLVRRIAVDRRPPWAKLVLRAMEGLRAVWRTTLGARGR